MSQCAVCGAQTRLGMGHCDRCWELVNSVGSQEAHRRIAAEVGSLTGSPVIAHDNQPMQSPFDNPRFRWGALGLIVGAVVGFLTRPAAFLVGQLPFLTVISRGSNLSGMDQLLVPTAQASFNQMLFLALLGGGIGFAVPSLIRPPNVVSSVSGSHPPSPSVGVDSVKKSANAEVLNNEAVLKLLEAGLGDEVILEKMKHSRCAFALSASDLTQLKQRGVSDRVITEMLKNQTTNGT